MWPLIHYLPPPPITVSYPHTTNEPHSKFILRGWHSPEVMDWIEVQIATHREPLFAFSGHREAERKRDNRYQQCLPKIYRRHPSMRERQQRCVSILSQTRSPVLRLDGRGASHADWPPPSLQFWENGREHPLFLRIHTPSSRKRGFPQDGVVWRKTLSLFLQSTAAPLSFFSESYVNIHTWSVTTSWTWLFATGYICLLYIYTPTVECFELWIRLVIRWH